MKTKKISHELTKSDTVREKKKKTLKMHVFHYYKEKNGQEENMVYYLLNTLRSFPKLK